MSNNKKILISWLMKSYGAGFLGNVTIAINEPNQKNEYNQNVLFKKWRDKNYEIICLVSKSDIKNDNLNIPQINLLNLFNNYENIFNLLLDLNCDDNFWKDGIKEIEKIQVEIKERINTIKNVYLTQNLISIMSAKLSEIKNTYKLFSILHLMDYHFQLSYMDKFWNNFKIQHYNGDVENIESVIMFLKKNVIENIVN